MKVIFRVDASVLIGSGHVMRCLVLADVLSARNWDIEFVCLPQDGDLIGFIEQKGYSVVRLPPPNVFKKPRFDGDYESWLQRTQDEDAANFVSFAGGVDWVVVDHYGIAEEWETRVGKAVNCKLLAIDDLNRKHESSLILDQNLWPDMKTRYSSCSATKLLGPEYALLRPHFKTLRLSAPSKKNQVIAFFGGSDPTQECEKLLEAAFRMSDLPFKLKVVAGGLNQKFDELLKYAEVEHIEVVQFIDDFELDLASSKYAIGASGVSNWERFCLNIPATIVSVAANQKALSEYLFQQKLVSYLGDGQTTTSKLYQIELNRIALQWDSIRPSNQLNVDGNGAEKVAKTMECY
ncbi:UDP-2,4-diacetamido-2,4,6-trideoxy-beta-L-altropyranose hydrolase [Vibrio fluvialis]|nr:UDP-2,4-diacetamido-2,4,6-trideoxy-beta-L-altropyranose hydrolase [Vibrio fluvialis]